MHFLEEELKKRLQDARSTEGIDAEKLWADIEGGLPQPEKRDRRWPLLFLCAGLLMGLAAWLFFAPQNVGPNPVLPAQNAGKPSSESVGRNSEAALNSSKNQALTTKNNQAPDSKPTVEPPSKSPGEIQSISFATTENWAAPKDFFSNKKQPDAHFENTGERKTAPAAVEKAFLNEKTAAGFQENRPVVFEEKPPTTELEIGPKNTPEAVVVPHAFFQIPTLPLRQFPFFEKRGDPNLPVIAAPAPVLLTKKQPLKKWALGILAGGNLFSQKFSGGTALAADLNKHTHAEIGQQLSVEIHWKLNKTIRFGSGLGIVSAHSKFNIVKQWDTLLAVKPYTFRATRTVIHHNRYQFLSLPLTLGAAKDFGEFGIGLDMGVGLNWLVAQSGRTLDAGGEIVDFGGKSTGKLPLGAFFLSGIANPYVEIRPKPGFLLRLQPTLFLQKNGSSELYGLKTRSMLTGVSLGVFRQF